MKRNVHIVIMFFILASGFIACQKELNFPETIAPPPPPPPPRIIPDSPFVSKNYHLIPGTAGFDTTYKFEFEYDASKRLRKISGYRYNGSYAFEASSTYFYHGSDTVFYKEETYAIGLMAILTDTIYYFYDSHDVKWKDSMHHASGYKVVTELPVTGGILRTKTNLSSGNLQVETDTIFQTIVNGEIVEEQNRLGGTRIIRYEFDQNQNPFYRTHMLNFNNYFYNTRSFQSLSRHNFTKLTEIPPSGPQHVRTFDYEYNRLGLPIYIHESYGSGTSSYYFVYQP